MRSVVILCSADTQETYYNGAPVEKSLPQALEEAGVGNHKENVVAVEGDPCCCLFVDYLFRLNDPKHPTLAKKVMS